MGAEERGGPPSHQREGCKKGREWSKKAGTAEERGEEGAEKGGHFVFFTFPSVLFWEDANVTWP